ncbi:hypothetical protein EVAR_90593_1 [Eumeta japonica]|uniref:Uncharacterized protein n=1 Tax=Eumeta variegata TaxID=151549 RepID=A0A4C1SAD3_EUMVA|nr:hypothetical protein EVAR_90593_1 [Eumeta japonica]
MRIIDIERPLTFTGGRPYCDLSKLARHDPGPLITDGSPYKYKARNSAAVKLVTKALQWHTIDRRGEEGRSRSIKPARYIIRKQFRTARYAVDPNGDVA